MRRVLVWLVCFAVATPGFGYVLEGVAGEGTEAQISLGGWYAFWFPGSATRGGKNLDLEVDPSLLKESALRIYVLGNTSLSLDYISDKFFEDFRFSNDEKISNNIETTVDILKFAGSHFFENIGIEGSSVIGRFRGEAKPGSDSDFDTVTVDGTSFSQNQPFQWSTGFGLYQLNFLYNLSGAFGSGGDDTTFAMGLGVRFATYSNPVVYNVRYGALPLVFDQFILTSEFSGTYINLIPMYIRTRGETFVEVDSSLSFGRGKYKSDFLTDVPVKLFGAEVNLRIGFDLISSNFAGVSLYLGGRFTYFAAETKLGTQTQTATVTQDIQGAATGTEVEVFMLTRDVFIGPTFGAMLRF